MQNNFMKSSLNTKIAHINIFVIFMVLLSGSIFSVNNVQASGKDVSKSASVKRFPREMRLPDSTLIVYQPQLEEWINHKTLIGWAAVLIKPDNSKNTIAGAVKISASTDVDQDARTVVAYNKKLLEVNFPTLKQKQIDELKTNIRKSISKVPEMIPMDMLLAAMGDKDIRSKPVTVSVKPPKIFYSEHDALLLLFDGKPSFVQIKNTSLKFAINTNWDLFLDANSKNYYLRNDKQWLVTSDINGTWLVTTKLPADLARLPDDENWKAVLQAIPAKSVGNEISQDVKVSFKPAELIVTKGKPQQVLIKGTKLSYVKNSDSDLFYHKTSKHYYFLVSGRWFKAKKLNGSWLYVKDLPNDFKNIPSDHVKASVLASVPGTEEAKLAILQAQIPHKATVKRSNKGVNVSYTGKPEFKPIKGTTLSYAVNTRFDVIQAGKSYYLCYQGVWFLAANPKGPWTVADAIPKEIYNIPPDSPKYNVVYVRIYDSSESTVIVGYTAGYHNMYFSYGVVMYGTGYYYPPYWYSYPYYPYPIYYPYYPSYGVAAYYNPYTGTYGRGAYRYGPYGGYGRGASYNPESGRYSRGVAAWGSSEGIYARQAYNPSTGVSSRTVQSVNSYAQWGNSVIRHGDDWIKTSHYTDDKGTRRQFETSQGAKGVQLKGDEHSLGIAKNKEGELFVGKDKNVYKRTDEGWQKQDGNGWAPVDTEAAKNKLNEKGVTRDSAAENISNRYNERNTTQSTRKDWSGNSNINQLNRDSQARTYGNQRYNDFNSRQQSGNLYNRGAQSGGRSFNRPSGGGGRLRR